MPARGLKPPPTVTKIDMLYDVRDKKAGFALNYEAEVWLPGCYPPRKENGKYVAYLSSAEFGAAFAGSIAGELDVNLPEKAAKALAKKMKDGTWSTPIYRTYVVKREAGREVCFVYDKDDHSFVEVQLQLELQSGDGLGDIDFEMLDEIEAGGPKAWTRNAKAEHEFRVFAQDGSGGLVAFWLVHHDDGVARPLAEQPVVFLGSEGAAGPIARDLADFMHLLAAGVGPYEVVEYGDTEGEEPQPAIAKLAKKFFPKRKKRDAETIILEAQRDFGDLGDRLEALRPR
jgi:hypothetical protein